MLPALCRQLIFASCVSARANIARGGLLLIYILISGCAGPKTVDFSAGHAIDEQPAEKQLPTVVADSPKVPEPVEAAPVQTYTVVVKEVPVIDLLFSLSRDAGLDLDIQATPDKTVTLNAVDRPLPEILRRIADQAKLRYQLHGSNLIIEDDHPYWYNYLVDYVNVVRSSEGEVGVATQISTAGGSVGEDSGGSGGQGQSGGDGNRSTATITNTSSNDFWTHLKSGLTTLVQDNDGATTSPVDMNPVIVNEMSGVVTVHGTQAEQRRVQEYLDQTMASAQRQVLIEMTIVEVELSDNYQAGVDWQVLGNSDGEGLAFQSELLGADLVTPPFVQLGFSDTDSSGNSVSATVRMLQQFGDTKVLSSPKIMALNNQSALLKVVNETVYFTIELDIREATLDIPERRTFTSQLHTVPVGLVLSVTPQISDRGYVSLNVRPTISRITGYAVDPAPRLSGEDFDNLIPEIQVREIESLLQVFDGHTVILGGLMQNERQSQKDGVPGLSRIPGIGGLFSYTRDKMVKTELVIFLKPTIINDTNYPTDGASISDYYDASAQNEPTTKIEYRK